MNLKNEKVNRRFILAKIGNEYVRIPVAEIVFCNAKANYTHIHLQDGHTYVVKRSLISLEQELPAGKFFRAHKSVLVNMKWIRKLRVGATARAVMLDAIEVPVSRRKRGQLLLSLG